MTVDDDACDEVQRRDLAPTPPTRKRRRLRTDAELVVW